MPQDICRLYQVCCFYENLNNWSKISYCAAGYYCIYLHGRRNEGQEASPAWILKFALNYLEVKCFSLNFGISKIAFHHHWSLGSNPSEAHVYCFNRVGYSRSTEIMNGGAGKPAGL